MVCPKCGNEIDHDANFCTYCGNKVERQPMPVSPETDYALNEYTVVSQQYENVPPKKNRKLVIILIAIVSALIVFGALLFAAVKVIDAVGGGAFSISEMLTGSTDEEEEESDFEEEEDDGETDGEHDREELPEKEEDSIEERPVEEEKPAEERPVEEESAHAPERDDRPVEVPSAEESHTEETAPIAVTTKSLVSDRSIVPLIEKAYAVRAEADAKWDQVEEVSGECTYKGYIYMENPDNSDDNRIYLVFVMNATIKNAPIQFVYWVYFDDIAFDDAGNVTYADCGSSRDDGYTVKTGFGSYYSYYGLDDFQMFEEYILNSQRGYKIEKKDLLEVTIEHPVSDTW